MSLAPDVVCAVVARTRHKMLQVEVQEAAKRGAKLVEVRIDFLTKAIDYKRLQPHKQCQWLATIRRPADGGRWSGTEAERQMVLRQAIVSGCFEWIDIESDIADSIRRFGTVKRVVSYHNMIETPPDLDDIYDRMAKQDADIVKIAVMPQTPADVGRILALQKRAEKPSIVFGMGDLGFPTRFTALAFGAPWIYALFNKDRELAPGMPAFSDFRTTYPVRSIDDETKFYGLFGDPVGHSLSPIVHNHLFLRNKVNAFYVPCRVPEGKLAEAIAAYKQVPFHGFSVTIPHKTAAMAAAKDHDPTVTTVGAANTLLLKKDLGFSAVNTDYPALLESIRCHLEETALSRNSRIREFAGLHVLVLGAGGVSRAAAYALHRAGAHVTIASRTAATANSLAAEIGCKSVDWAARHNVTPCELLINGTPLGMHPNVDETPIHHSFLTQDMVVFDTVYNPEQTLLIREARERKAGTITGVELFVRQAAKQFELFTKVEPSLEMIRELVRKALSPLTKALDDEARKSGLAEEEPPEAT
jgi:3-dehydroquinate dehydratase / shikimate dehydrogenase